MAIKLVDKLNSLIGDWKEYSLEYRIYNSFLLICIAFGLPCSIFDLIVGFYSFAFWSLVVIAFCGFLYWLGRFKGHYFTFALFVAVNVFFCWLYLNSNGLKGSGIFYFFITLFVVLGMNKTKYHAIMLSMQTAIIGGLIAAERFFPSIIANPYKSQDDWYYDVVFSIAIILMFCSFVIFYIRYSFEKEKELNDKQRKEIEEHSLQRSMFFLNLAHEIKTPLTLIRNYLDKYTEQVSSNDHLDIVRQNLDKMSRDIIHFMNIEKLDKGVELYDQKQVISLSRFAESKSDFFKPYATKKGIKIVSSIEPHIGVFADPMAIDHILNNLLDNAVKYTPENGEIKLSIYGVDNESIISIKDSGNGISVEQREHIFDAFYQISHAKQNSQGLGMGLYIVKKLVDSLGGSLKLESVLGNGSEFTIILPYIFVDDSKTNLPPSQVPIGITYSAPPVTDTIYRTDYKNIMVVEDNPDLLRFLRDEISKSYNVFVAINGNEAIQKLSHCPKPDVFVSDIMMDTMDGFELINWIKKNPSFYDIPFIFLSAKSQDSDKLEGIDLGAVDYIPKPFSLAELLSKISSILADRDRIYEILKEDASNQIFSSLAKNSPKDGSDIKSIDIQMAKYGISPREKEVFFLMQQGMKYEEIGQKLFISSRTVVRHVQNMYGKTTTNSRLELINKITS